LVLAVDLTCLYGLERRFFAKELERTQFEYSPRIIYCDGVASESNLSYEYTLRIEIYE
jgi:hypothetical protein